MTSVDEMTHFKDKYTPIHDAVASWTFDKTPWVFKEAEQFSTEEKKLFKKIEGYISQFDPWLQMLSRVVPRMQFTSEENRKTVETTIDKMKNAEGLVKEIGLIQTCNVLSCLLLKDDSTSKTLDASVKYCVNVLKIPESDFPSTIRSKIASMTNPADCSTSAAVSASAIVPSSSLSGDSHNAALNKPIRIRRM